MSESPHQPPVEPVYGDPTSAPVHPVPPADQPWSRPYPTMPDTTGSVYTVPAPTPLTDPNASGFGMYPSAYPVPVAQPVPAQARRGGRAKWGRTAGGGGAAVGIVAKFWLVFKGLAVLLKFKTVFSILIVVWLYAEFWGWRFAVGFVAIMFIHEMGHVVVFRLQGIKVSAPMFVPFLGAFVTMKTPPRSVAAEAAGALAGPAFGLAASSAVLAAGVATDSPFLTALAYTGFFLNLFNLLPMLPLDGGRVAGALHPAVWFVGLAGALAFLVWRPSAVLVLVLVIGGMELARRWKAHRSGASNAYHAIGRTLRWQIGGAYAAVAVLCLAGMLYSYAPLN